MAQPNPPGEQQWVQPFGDQPSDEAGGRIPARAVKEVVCVLRSLLAAAGRAARDSAKAQACPSARPRLKRSVRRICGRRKRTRKEMSGATNRSALLNTGLGVPVELCPDAPGDNDLSPGTWTRRHRSQIVSDRNLVKSSSKEDVSDEYAGLGTVESGPSNPKHQRTVWRIQSQVRRRSGMRDWPWQWQH